MNAFRRVMVIAIFAGLSVGSAHATGEMKAGAARVVITPKQDMWMAGYAARREPSAGKVHDLYARAVVIEDETGAKAAFVSTDLLGLTRSLSSRAAELAKSKLGIDRERLMFTASHTHCGPVVRENLITMYPLNDEQKKLVDEYTDSLPGLIVQAIEQAASNLEPCDFTQGIGSVGFAINRRQFDPEGVKIGHNPSGPMDHDVPVLQLKAKSGAAKAILFGYACHNTTLSFQQLCGDYAGFAELELEKKIPGATALFFAGCGGDQNPYPRGELAHAEQHGVALADAVLATTSDSMKTVGSPLKAVYKEIPLALETPPSREELEKQTQSTDIYVQNRARALIKKFDAGGKLDSTYPYPIQVWKFGDSLQMIALGGEVVVDYSLRLKKELGREGNFIIAYANDVMAYIPSLRVLREGGYEGGGAMVYYGLPTSWTADVEEHIIRTVHELIAK